MMETKYAGWRPNNDTLKWLGRIRRSMRQMLDTAPFAGNEISADDYEEWADSPEGIAASRRHDDPHAFFRVRHEDVRRFHIPSGKQELFNNIEEAFDPIELVSKWHVRTRDASEDGSVFGPQMVDSLAGDSIQLGMLIAKIAADLKHRSLSTPRKAKLFDDPKMAKEARDEISKRLRDSRSVTFHGPTERAAVTLSAKGITTSGRTLRKSFPELDPKNKG